MDVALIGFGEAGQALAAGWQPLRLCSSIFMNELEDADILHHGLGMETPKWLNSITK